MTTFPRAPKQVHVIRIMIGLAFVTSQILLSWCFSRHFDFTDEGLYLYALNNAPEFNGFNLYHHLLHPFGKIFDYRVGGWRWFGAVLLQISGAYLLTSAKLSGKLSEFRPFELAMLGAVFGLSYYYSVLIFTPGYNLLIAASCMCLLGALTRIVYERGRTGPAFIASVSIFILFTCRISAPIVMALPLFSVFCVLPKSRRTLLSVALLSLVWITSLYFWKSDQFKWMLSILPVLAETSHDRLWNSLVDSILSISAVAIVLATIRFVSSRFLGRQSGRFFYSAVGVFLAVVLTLINDRILKSELLLGCIYFCILDLSFRQRDKRDRLIALSVCFCSIAIHIGTNGSLSIQALNFAVVLLFVIPWTVPQQWVARGLHAIIPISFYTLIAIDSNYYREIGTEQKVRVNLPGTPIDGIEISKSGNDVLTSLQQILLQERVHERRLPIFVYADLPGLVSALGARAIGTPWYVTGYRNIDKFNCTYFESNIHLFETVFYVQSFEMSAGMKECVGRTTVSRDQMLPIGEMQDTRDGKGLLRLTWGYLVSVSN